MVWCGVVIVYVGFGVCSGDSIVVEIFTFIKFKFNLIFAGLVLFTTEFFKIISVSDNYRTSGNFHPI